MSLRIAGSVDVLEALASLSRRRPLFHSEADFQHELAWEVRLGDPTIQVRLETRPRKGARLDLLFVKPEARLYTAIEVKYLAAALCISVAGEEFDLPHQAAQDVRGYDVLKDLARLEEFTLGRLGWNGFGILLTNDQSYWRAPSRGRATNADAFRLHEGINLSGTCAWGPNTGAGTMRGRAEPIQLSGNYRLTWRDYSDLGGRNGRFRTLVVEVT